MSSPAPAPQSVTPSVAFEIPIKKKEFDESSLSSVQRRLANSPRREVSLDEINNKLIEASKRKEATVLNSKTARHNAAVAEKAKTVEAAEAEKSRSLEENINTKLSNAETKRDAMASNWMQRLSQSTRNKLSRGAKVKEEEKWSAKELETNLDLKGITADLRREERKLLSQQEIAITNGSKIRRGQLAKDLEEIEAKKKQNENEQKRLEAEERRDKLIREQTSKLQILATQKQEKVEDALKKEEEEAAKRRAEIEAKIRSAEDRKDQAIAGKVETISTKINDKLQRAADVRRQEDERMRKKEEHIINKVELANRRKDKAIQDQKKALLMSATKKEARVLDKQRQEEESIAHRQKGLQSKLSSAEAKREEILAGRVLAARSEHENKQMKAKKAWLSSLNESKELKETTERKHKIVEERKQKMLQEMVDKAKGANKFKVDKVEKLVKTKEREELKSLVKIEKKLAVVSSKREENLLRVQSSTKKRLLTPKSSPSEKEIEERICAANNRREIFLTSKVDKASKSGKISPKVKKTLFAAVSPMRDVDDTSELLSPRIKAARLEEFQEEIPQDERDQHQYHHGRMLAIGGIVAVVVVGLLSFLKK